MFHYPLTTHLAVILPSAHCFFAHVPPGKDFLGGGGDGVLFVVNALNGKSLEGMTAFPTECELLMPSNTCMRVRAVADAGMRRYPLK